jgi:acetate---CoA ligase (ADP-forming)
MTRARLQRLLVPRHIAFVGGRSLEPAIRNAEDLGFTGDIWVVNPHYDTIAGRQCYPTVAALPAAPDAAFIGVGRERTIEAVRELAARGAGGCVCLANGFAELGDDGRRLQDELAAAAGALALIGPNCYGVLNYADRVALWPDHHGGAPAAAGAAFVAQSGNLSLNATMADRSLTLTHVLSIGNQAVTTFGTCIDVLLDDPRVRAIGLYVEDLVDVEGFAAAATRALEQGVPIVVLRSGVSPTSAGVVAGHTGARAAGGGQQALFRRLGIFQVTSLSALLETLKLLVAWPEAGGSALAAVAASGGDVAVLADLAARAGLGFPALDAATRSALRDQLGDHVVLGNPLDFNTGVWGRPDELAACFTSVMAGAYDAVVLVIDYPRAGSGDPTPWDDTVDAFIAAHERTGRPAAVVSSLPEGLPRAVRERMLAHGVVPLQGMAEAVTALAGAAAHRGRRAAVLAGEAGHVPA